MKQRDVKRGDIVIYKSAQGPEIQVKLEEDTVWLDAHLIAKLFEIDRTVVVKHINNIYKSNELSEKSTCAKIAQVAADGKVRKMNLYNLDMIISVGYRVNSKRATDFRIWATKTLKNHLVKGYTLNKKRLLQTHNTLKDLQETIFLLQEKAKHILLEGQEQEILNLLANYSTTLTLLEQYDKQKLAISKKGESKFIIKYEQAKDIIKQLKQELITKKEASDLFGKENGDKLKGILGNIYQTFDKKRIISISGRKSFASILFNY